VSQTLDRTPLLDELRAGVAALGLDLGEPLLERQIDYLALLVKWNKVYNLTAVREPQEMVARHLLDSLSILPWLQGESAVDVGSGAGIPGIPLALAAPERAWTLLDSNGKKSRFQQQARIELGLARLTVVHSRVESWRPETPFAQLTARAFTALGEIAEGARPLLAPGGEVLAMKAQLSTTELSGIPEGFSLTEVVELKVPGLEHEQRHLVRLTLRGE